MTEETQTAPETPAAPETTPEAPVLDFNAYTAALPESHRELLTKNNVTSFEAQEKWISNLNSMVGKKGLIAPDENATPEEKTAYREQLLDQLGRPKDGGYEFTLPEGSKDEFYTDEFMNSFASVAHEAGLSADGFQKVVDFIGTQFNGVLSEWEKTIGEINAKLGEDRMDDKASGKQTVTRDSIRDMAKAKSVEASEKFRNGDYKNAELLKAEAQKLYDQYASM